MKLSSRGKSALWIGGGAFVGLAVGALLVAPDAAISLSGLWLAGLAVFAGIVIGLTRERTARAVSEMKAKHAARGAPAPVAPPATASALRVRFDLPDVPDGYPPVMGRGEPIQVRIVVLHAGEPSEGAAVQLDASMDGETLKGDGVTGTQGAVEFTLEPEGAGELVLVAEAKAGKHEGRANAAVSIVEYEHEIERLFGEFRAYAVGILGPEAHADTARELCDKLRQRAGPETARALLELARVYELVAYGERTADRRLYLALMEQLMVLEQAEMPDNGRGAVSREV